MQVCVAVARLQRRSSDFTAASSSSSALSPLPAPAVTANMEPDETSAPGVHSNESDSLWTDVYLARYMNCPGVYCAEYYLFQDAELLAAITALPSATSSPGTAGAAVDMPAPSFRLVCYSTLQPCHFSGDGDKETVSCVNAWLEFAHRVLAPKSVALVR